MKNILVILLVGFSGPVLAKSPGGKRHLSFDQGTFDAALNIISNIKIGDTPVAVAQPNHYNRVLYITATTGVVFLIAHLLLPKQSALGRRLFLTGRQLSLPKVTGLSLLAAIPIDLLDRWYNILQAPPSLSSSLMKEGEGIQFLINLAKSPEGRLVLSQLAYADLKFYRFLTNFIHLGPAEV